ncbi:MAG: ATP-binding cassette domain-containing protein [Planctomycetes bacterium]|nr:ATP-binding cassette domain-containing protein [Planctomycetota bacterium]
MLQVRNLKKSYGGKVLFDDVSFALTPRERLGLVGRNDSGKTTLFRLLLGEEQPDDGIIEAPRRYRIGHVSQLLQFEGDTVLAEACRGLESGTDLRPETHRAEKMLAGLGFDPADIRKAPSQVSGGLQVRLQLARVLLSAPQLLLLDEPTNYLDIVAIRWLERFLRGWPNELILVTHDQDFMDSITTHTMAIHRQRVRRVEGTTTKVYALLSQDEEIYEQTRRNEARERRRVERFIERFRAKATKARSVQSRIKMLEKRATLERLSAIPSLEFQFNAAPFAGNHLLACSELEFRYVEASPLLLGGISVEVKSGERIGVIGKNGKGKSTLLRLLAGELPPCAGSIARNPSLRLAHFGQDNIERLHSERTVEEEVMAAHPDHERRAARDICGAMMFEGDEALKRIRVLSGGERARVLLGKLLVTPANLLLLDEPTNHLDADAIDSLIEAIAAFPGGVLFVTHNERMLRALATRLLVFDRGSARLFEGTYADFLERIGWADEDESRLASAKTDANGRGRQEERRLRAARVTRRSRLLRPLDDAIARCESEIAELEERRRAAQEGLCEASRTSEGGAIARLSRELHGLGGEIDERYQALERALTERERTAEALDAEEAGS